MKNVKWRLKILTFAIEWCNCENSTRDLDLLFGGKFFKTFIHLKRSKLEQTKCVEGIYRF